MDINGALIDIDVTPPDDITSFRDGKLPDRALNSLNSSLSLTDEDARPSVIRYTLQCENAHRFEGWFQNSGAFDAQASAGHISCPECGSVSVEKSLMTPGIPKKAENSEAGPREFFNQMRALRSKVMEGTDDVGAAFPDQARQMHEGEKEHKPIRGEATPEEVKELKEDGVPIMPVPPEPPAEN